MKNLSKFLLFVLLVFAGYFSVVVYGQCSIAGWNICNDWEICTNGSFCHCGLWTVEDGKPCNPTDPMDDWEPTEINIWDRCYDPNGCICEWEELLSWNQCLITNTSTPIPVLSKVNIITDDNNRTAIFKFNTDVWPINITSNWSCWSISRIFNTWNNEITFSNLSYNRKYDDCWIIWQYNWKTSKPLDIPSFTITSQWWGSSGWGGWGWSSSAICTDIYLTCLDWIYTLKSWYYCIGGNLWKSCGVSSMDTETMRILEDIKETKSTVYEYTPQWIKVRIYVPKFKQSILRRTVLSLNQNLYKAINKKLLKVTDPSYMIENFEYLEADSKILVYKEIWSIVKLYNDFLWIFYLFVDMWKRDYLPLARTYFEAYLKEFVMFNR